MTACRSARSLGHPVEEIEVAAGRERSPFAGDDGNAGVVVRAQLREETGDCKVQLVVHGVELVRTHEPDDPHRSVDVDADDAREVVVHRSSFFVVVGPLSPSAGRGSAWR